MLESSIHFSRTGALLESFTTSPADSAVSGCVRVVSDAAAARIGCRSEGLPPRHAVSDAVNTHASARVVFNLCFLLLPALLTAILRRRRFTAENKNVRV